MSGFIRSSGTTDPHRDAIKSFYAKQTQPSQAYQRRLGKLTIMLLCTSTVLLTACGLTRDKNEFPLKEYAHLPIAGYNHTDSEINGFRVDSSAGAYMKAQRPSLAKYCCFPVPRVYKPGMTVKILKHGERVGSEKTVAVPPYTQDELGHVAVHFLANGDIKVFVTQYYETHQNYPFPEARVKVDGKFETRSPYAWP